MFVQHTTQRARRPVIWAGQRSAP